MDFDGVEIVCPSCRSDLTREGDDREGVLTCSSCAHTYPIIAGIPDLRLWPDPYISFAADRAKGRMLDEHAGELDFAAAIRFYYSVTEKVPPFQARRFERGLLAAALRARHSLERWEMEVGGGAAHSRLLEIGCGTAPLLEAAAPRYAQVVGVDIAFRWLVLGRRRLESAGMRVPLICACAEALPFPSATFDRVVVDSTIEHLRSPPQSMQECVRVMAENGWLMGATPNRFSLGPDPHVGIPAGGYLPNGLISTYVKRKGGIPPQRKLQSIGSLDRLLAEAGFEDIRVWAPEVPAQQVRGFGTAVRAGVRAYNQVLRLPPGRFVLNRIGPLLHVVARRGAAQAGSPMSGNAGKAALSPAPADPTP